MNRPRVFISTVTRELRGARQRVANILARRGYEPVWQDVFGTEPGDLRDMLRKQIASCHGLIQIIGDAYGSEPPSPDPDYGRCSYTQFEFLHARKLGKKTWLLIAGPGCERDTPPAQLDLPDDPAHPGPAGFQSERQQLQRDYRQRPEVRDHLFHEAESDLALDLAIERLHDDLAALRIEFGAWQRTVLRLAAAVVILGLIALGVQIWTKKHQDAGLGTLADSQKELLAQVGALKDQLTRIKLDGEPDRKVVEAVIAALKAKDSKADAGSIADAEKEAAKKLGIGIKELRAQMAKARDNAAERLRLTAELATLAAPRPGADAEEEKLRQQTREVARRERIWALRDLAYGERLAIRYAEANRLLREAESLTDKQSDEGEWASVQWNLALVEDENGQYASTERRYRAILPYYRREQGLEHPNTLGIRNNLAGALRAQGKHAEAEAEYRAVLKIRERVLGPEHPDTMSNRNNLATALDDQGKDPEAEAEYRAVLKLRERVLGPEHADTLSSRYNLAIALRVQGQHVEAEAEHRAVLKLRERVLGPDHPDTLRSRNSLASALGAKGQHAEAEAEYRAVLKLYERVLGSEHPDTLSSRNNLANELDNQSKHAEAEVEFRAVLKLQDRVLGPEHPDTLSSRNNLALTLCVPKVKLPRPRPSFGRS